MTVSPDATPERYRLLVVDDEQAIHKLLSAYLQRHNFEVVSCLHSREIIQKVTEFQPDLILLDLMMPEVDGFSATRRVRNMELSSYLPIIILTAKKESRDMVTALEAGADDYITKPFDFDELMARVRNMLRLKSLQDNLMRKTAEIKEASQQISRLNSVLVDTNKQLQRKVYDFHNLFEVSYRVMGQLEFSRLVRQALIHILGIFGTRNAILMLSNRDDENLFEVVEAKGIKKEVVEELRFSRHDRLMHLLELTRKAFQIRDIPEEFADVARQLQETDLAAAAPLFRNDDVVGLLLLGPNFKNEEYSQDSLETLGILSNMLSVAVHNAHMYARIREMSYTDGMTGLHNYRFFRLRFKEEVARARRENMPLSLLIMDVDNFKNYNDTLGHPAGDDVLRKVSNILKMSVRDHDIVARYGGEEFAVILPRAGQVGAYTLAERIRSKVEQEHFFKQEVQPLGTVTLSIGVATFPQDAVTEKEVILKADQALYVAKNAGRNRVVESKDIEVET